MMMVIALARSGSSFGQFVGLLGSKKKSIALRVYDSCYDTQERARDLAVYFGEFKKQIC